MREKYITPESEIIIFDTEDVITTSSLIPTLDEDEVPAIKS